MTKRGTVTIDGVTTETTGTFTYASLYRAIGTSLYAGETFFKFHRTEASAAKGSWSSADMKKTWKHVGYAAIQF